MRGDDGADHAALWTRSHGDDLDLGDDGKIVNDVRTRDNGHTHTGNLVFFQFLSPYLFIFC